jgi:hypothetical protein
MKGYKAKSAKQKRLQGKAQRKLKNQVQASTDAFSVESHRTSQFL